MTAGARVERRGAAAILLLDRPPANVYDYGLLRELDAALDAVRLDESISGLVVASSSPRFFCGGADLDAFARASGRGREMTCLLAQEVFAKLERLPIASVAAIAGECLGGGLELALACRSRFAVDGDYRLGLPEVGVGLLPGSGGTQRLTRLVGLSRGLDAIVSGRLLRPVEALGIGLVDRLFPDSAACLDAAVAAARARASDEMEAPGDPGQSRLRVQ